MKSFDYYAVVYDGEVCCVECLPSDVDVESDEVGPIFADSEWDYYPVCSVCNTVHDYVGLTSDGQRYETEQAGPQEGDIVFSDTGPLGGLTSVGVFNGKHIGNFKDLAMAQQAAHEYCENECESPNWWYISDHGNAHLMDV